MVNTKIRLIIFFAAKDGEALYSQQKQDQGEKSVYCLLRHHGGSGDTGRLSVSTPLFLGSCRLWDSIDCPEGVTDGHGLAVGLKLVAFLIWALGKVNFQECTCGVCITLTLVR